ncbi:MAG TPA: rhodanese-like domain-containing protein [Candidatus Atopostipes pullistercoris]|uniref:Rhodanese-like domain-containing protein n=1 Tax=Candidatus Atopostipes pullistercoris TaxID=2838467 RepID=A0A9D2G142_9LACT|nr:rhodanese-like domain-containing protein [Candidatus Atopostipes pullistercoris]
MSTFALILWIILILWGIWELIQYFRRKRSAVALESEEFKKDLRKKQLIDVREKDEFDAGHILGARNIPFFEIKQRYVELRKDQPIYLYEAGTYAAYRAAIELRKHGFEDLFVLKGGYDNWEGRIKRNKKKLED